MPFNQGINRPQGDPGFFSFLGKTLGTVARAIPGPIGAIAGAVTRPSPRAPAPPPITPFVQQRPTPGVLGAIQRAVPGGATGFECPPRRKRRSIDPLNMKALRRANRRQKAFLRAVDSTLKTMPTKASVSRRRQQIRGAK